jgi:hypothetical protein
MPKAKEEPKQAAKGKPTKKEEKAKEKKPEQAKGGAAKYVIAILIIVVIIIVALFAGVILNPKSPNNSSFETFKKNYDSAARVNIFVAGYNGSILSSTIGCATAIIEQTVASKTNHRNSSTIDLNIINQTSCIRSKGLGVIGANYITTSLQNCLNTTATEPTIYINYSKQNTTIIRPEYLYVSGDALFLSECGLAPEISS